MSAATSAACAASIAAMAAANNNSSHDWSNIDYEGTGAGILAGVVLACVFFLSVVVIACS